MLNTVVIQGRVGNDIELKQTQNGKEVVSVNIACTRNYKNTEGKYDADWFTCVAFGNTAKFMSQNFSKGQEIIVNGELMTRKWTDKDGNNRISTEVRVNNVYFCGSKGSGENTAKNPDVPHFEEVAEDEDFPF